MFKSLYHWKLRSKEEEIDASLLEDFKISPIQKEFLERRKLTRREDLESVLSPKYGDANNIYDMDRAVNLIKSHINKKNTILIYGDYDADGITSTTLIYSALLEVTENVHFFIPNRVDHGYGPNYDFFENEVVGNVDLVITVDNGVTAVKEIELLNQNNIDTIIIDHHEFASEIPECVIIHPNHPKGNYSDKHLAGVGITYKVVEALGLLKPEHIGLAAIGTIADMVPMFGENKRIVIDGLKYLNTHLPIGLRTLMSLQGQINEIDTETVGFFLAPRLNSTGRISEASIGVELFMTDDLNYAEMLAREIEELNTTRKEMVEMTLKEASRETISDNKVQVIFSEDWHPGILGIVASRIVEASGVPSILLTKDEGVYKGSSRSIDGIDFLTHLGNLKTPHIAHGHAQAFGITIPEENIHEFKDELVFYMNHHLKEVKPTRLIDIELKEDFTFDHLEALYQLAPFGQDFNAPIFEITNFTINEIKQIGRDKNHLKFKVNESAVDFIGFNFGQVYYEVSLNDKISAIGKLNVNEFNGNRKLQMLVEDVKVEELRLLDMRAKNDQNFELIKETDIFLIQEGKEKKGDNYFSYGERIPFIINTLVLRDLPINLDAFEESLKSLKVNKIIAILHEKESLFFQGAPKERDVKNAYYMILKAKNGAIDLKIHAPMFAKKLNVSMQILQKIMNILTDLYRIKLVNGVVFYNPEKTDDVLVSESKYYRSLQNKIESEAKLKMSSRPELKNYLTELLASDMN